MADISKGKRSTGRRSSILKRALADIDVNVKEKKEKHTRRPSKRVSFAETYVVKEFPRDSPQTLKDKQDEDDTEPEQPALCNVATPASAVQPVIMAEQPFIDADTSAVSFVVEEGETAFISGMAVADGFPRESTRIMDQNLVIVPPQQIWEPLPTEVLGNSLTETSVFMPPHAQLQPQPQPQPPPQSQPRRGLSFAATSASFPTSQPAPSQPASTAGFPASQTMLFDAQDEGSMELTMVNMPAGELETRVDVEEPPKMSARDFLSKMMGSGGQVTGVAQVREERTILFTNMDQGNNMELTGMHDNYTFTHTTSATTSTIRRSAGPLQPIHTSVAAADKTVFFSTSDAGCDMNLTQNLSVMEESICNKSMMQNQSFGQDTRCAVQPRPQAQNLMSAKAFLASLRGSGSAFVRPLTANTSSTKLAPAVTAVTSQPDDMDMSMTMELTGCQDSARPPTLNASLSYSLMAPKPQPPPASTILPLSAAQTETACGMAQSFSQENFIGVTHEPSAALAQLTPATSLLTRPSQSVLLTTAAPIQVVTGSVTQNGEDMAETMELTGCVESTRQLLQDAGSSFIMASAQLANVAPLQPVNMADTQPSETTSTADVSSRKPLCVITLSKDATSTSGTDTKTASVIQQPPKVDIRAAPDMTKDSNASMAGFANAGLLGGLEMPRPKPISSEENLTVASAKAKATVRFSSEDTAAAMNLTGSAPEAPPISWSEEHTVRFTPEETAAAMDITLPAAQQTEPAPAEKSVSEEKTVHFALEDTGAAMEVTEYTDSPTDQLVSAAARQVEDKTLQFAPEDTRAAMEITQVVETPIEVKANQSTASSTKPAIANTTVMEPKIVTCVQSETGEKTVRFGDNTCAAMELTSVDLPSSEREELPVSESQSTQSAVSKENHATSATALSQTIQEPKQNKTICFSADETAAQMSITAPYHSIVSQPAPSRPLVLESAQRVTITKISDVGEPQLDIFKREPAPTRKTAEDTSFTCANVTHTNHAAIGEKTVTFGSDQKEADMDLTCATGQQNSQIASDRCEENKVTPKEQTQVFCTDETAANMSLTYGLTAANEDDAGGKEERGERTALMELSGVFAQLRCQLGMDNSGNVVVPSSHSESSAQPGNLLTTEKKVSDSIPASVSQISKEMETGQSRTAFVSRTQTAQAVCIPHTKAVVPFSQPNLLDTIMNKKPLSTVRPLTSTITKNSNTTAHLMCMDSNKRRLQTFSSLMPSAKLIKLSNLSAIQTEPPTSSDAQQIVSLDIQQTSDGPEKEEVDRKQSDEASPTEVLSRTRNGTMSDDIFGETMPELPGESVSSNPLSASVNPNITTSSMISLSRSFADIKNEFTEPPACVEQFLQALDIEVFELKPRRRSSGVFRPDLDFETPEDRLNVATVVKCECDVKVQTLQSLAQYVKQQEAAIEDLESEAMKHAASIVNTKTKSDEEVLQLSKTVRSLLSASRKRSQAAWKEHKAEMLHTYARTLGEKHQKMCSEMGEMTSAVETMTSMADRVKQSIEKAREQLEQIHIAASSRKNEVKQQPLQDNLKQKKTELASLRDKISTAESVQQELSQRVSQLRQEEERIKQRQATARDTQRQLGCVWEKLHALHNLLCWRPVRMEASRVDLLLLCDSVLLTVKLQGPASPQQQVLSLSVASRLQEGSQPWAQLATALVVDGLTAAADQLVSLFSCRQQLPQMLDEVSRLVDDARSLSQELKFASLRYLITITGKRVEAELFNVVKLRKVCLRADFPANSYPAHPLDWHVHIVMGDIREDQVKTVIAQTEAGSSHFTQVLDTVHRLLSS